MSRTFPFCFFLLALFWSASLPAQKNSQFQGPSEFLETLHYCEGEITGPPLSPNQASVQDRWNNPIFANPVNNQRTSPGAPLGGGAPAPLAPVDCANGFILTFEDIESNTNTGFDDPTPSPCGTGMTLGEERVNTVCAVFDYISNVIDMGAVNTQIYFTLSEFDGTGPLASAGPLFDVGLAPGTYQGGYLRDHIVNGVDPNPSSYDAVVSFDFGTRFLMGDPIEVNPCLPCPTGGIDMYTIMLHEATHALGFFSWIDQNGTSKHSGLLTGPFSLLDDHMLNGSDANLLTGGGAFAGPLVDISSDVIQYHGPGNTQYEPVYSPSVWSGGSSLSHFDDDRSSFHHVMHPSTSGGANRLYTMPEIEALVDFGYNLQPGVYTGPPADNNYVIGNDDVGYSTTPGTMICIPALNNDVDPDGDVISYGDCGSGCAGSGGDVTLVLGSGTVSIVGDDVCFTPEEWYGGPAVIKYCPTDGKYNSSLVNTDNCTYIFVDVEGPCPGDPCNLVCNGTFENRVDNCVTTLNFLTLWNDCPSTYIVNVCGTRGSADIMARGCPGNSLPVGAFDIPNNHGAALAPFPGTEVWDAPNPDNNTYISMNLDHVNDYVEGIYMELTEPLTPFETYEVSFWAASKTSTSEIGITPSMTTVGFKSDAPVWSGDADVNTVLDWYAPSNSPWFSVFPIASTAKNDVGVWNQYTFTVTPTIPNLRYLVIEPTLQLVAAYRNVIQLDEVRIVKAEPEILVEKTVSDSTPQPGDIITYTIKISNMDATNTATDITVEDLLPPGVTYINSTLSDPPTTHNIASLAPMTSVLVTITVSVDIDAPLGVPITNCAYVTSGNNCLNTSEENCADIVIRATDLAVTKTITSGPGPYAPGDIVTFEITAQNLGEYDTYFVDIEDIMPPGLSYVSHNIVGPGVYDNPNFEIIILSAGAQSVLTLNTIVSSNATCGTMTNCVNLNSMAIPDLVLSNNSSCVDFEVGVEGGIPASFPIHPSGGNKERVRGLHKPDIGLYVTGDFDKELDYGLGEMISLEHHQAYVVKYGTCDIDWQHEVGSPTGDDFGIGIETHPTTGRLYACGNASAPFNYEGVPIPCSGTYVVELNPDNGTAIWGHSIPNTEVADIAVDPGNGRVAVTGTVQGPFTFAGDPFNTMDGADIFVAVYDRDGTELWADTYGSATNKDFGKAIAFNGIGMLYVAGAIEGMPSGPFGFLPPAFAGGPSDGFVGRYSSTGVRQNGKFFATPGNDAINDIDIDPAGNRVFIAGINGGTMTVGGGPIITSFGGGDAFCARLFGSLNGVWAHNWGSIAPNDYAESIVYKNNRVFVGGGFRGTAAFPGFPNPTMTSFAGLDVFMCTMAANSGNPRNNIQSNNVGTWNLCWDIAAGDDRYGYLGGEFYGSTVFGATTLNSVDGNNDAFIARGYGESGGTFAKFGSETDKEEEPSGVLLSVYPNPTTGKLTLTPALGSLGHVRLTLVDMQGRTEVLQESASFEHGNVQLDLSHKAQGVYFLKMESDGLMQTEKVILLGD